VKVKGEPVPLQLEQLAPILKVSGTLVLGAIVGAPAVL
jgi:hypothetical protein